MKQQIDERKNNAFHSAPPHKSVDQSAFYRWILNTCFESARRIKNIEHTLKVIEERITDLEKGTQR